MTSPSILVVGATGNTGSAAVKHLSQLILSSSFLSNQSYRIIALTRDGNSAASKQLAQLNHVEVKEKDWTSIDSGWLIEANVSRVYLASHNFLSQFADESKFLIACKAALRANYFVSSIVLPCIEWLKSNKATDPMPFVLDENAPIAIINPEDVGEAAAKLLSLDDPSAHYRKKYNLSGPEDVTGKDIVSILEQVTHQKIQVDYKNLNLFMFMCKQAGYPESVWESLGYGRRDNLWTGLSRLSNTPTSPEMLAFAPPHSTVKEFIEQAFNQSNM